MEAAASAAAPATSAPRVAACPSPKNAQRRDKAIQDQKKVFLIFFSIFDKLFAIFFSWWV
jgi:hypothetical protein